MFTLDLCASKEHAASLLSVIIERAFHPGGQWIIVCARRRVTCYSKTEDNLSSLF